MNNDDDDRRRVFVFWTLPQFWSCLPALSTSKDLHIETYNVVTIKKHTHTHTHTQRVVEENFDWARYPKLLNHKANLCPKHMSLRSGRSFHCGFCWIGTSAFILKINSLNLYLFMELFLSQQVNGCCSRCHSFTVSFQCVCVERYPTLCTCMCGVINAK